MMAIYGTVMAATFNVKWRMCFDVTVALVYATDTTEMAYAKRLRRGQALEIVAFLLQMDSEISGYIALT